MSNTNIDDDNDADLIPKIVDELQSNPDTCRLSLTEKVSLDARQQAILFNAVDASSVSELLLQDVDLTKSDEWQRVLVSSKITDLQLLDVQLCSNDATFRALQTNVALQSLTVRFYDESECRSAVLSLLSALSANSTLTHLDLDIGLDDDGKLVEEIAPWLATNLPVISLKFNWRGELFPSSYIFANLVTNTKLERLCLGNVIGQCFGALVRFLNATQTLTYLSFAGSHDYDYFYVIDLLDCLATQSTLKTLDIGCEEEFSTLQGESTAMFRLIETNTTLKRLSAGCWDDEPSDDLRSNLRRALAVNRSLEFAQFGDEVLRPLPYNATPSLLDDNDDSDDNINDENDGGNKTTRQNTGQLVG